MTSFLDYLCKHQTFHKEKLKTMFRAYLEVFVRFFDQLRDFDNFKRVNRRNERIDRIHWLLPASSNGKYTARIFNV